MNSILGSIIAIVALVGIGLWAIALGNMEEFCFDNKKKGR